MAATRHHPPQLPPPVHLTADDARYTGAMRLNIPVPREVGAGASSIARKRAAGYVESVTLTTLVHGTRVRLHAGGRRAASGEAQGPGAPPPHAPCVDVASMRVDVGKECGEGAARTDDALPLLTAPKRPTRVVFTGARVLAGADEKDAVTDTVIDIINGFKAPARGAPLRAAAATADAAAAARGDAPDPSSPPRSPGVATGAVSPPPAAAAPPLGRPGSTPDGGDLLKLLLAQGAAPDAGGDTAAGRSSSPDDAPPSSPPPRRPPSTPRPLSASVAARLASPPPGGARAPRGGVAGAAAVPAPASPPSYEVIADGLQVCLCADSAPGRVLVTSTSARVVGGPPPGDPDRSAVLFDATGVALHACLTDVDPCGPPAWLDDDGKPPLDTAAGAAPERVVDPFDFCVRHASAAEGRRGRPPRADELAIDLPPLTARAPGAAFAVLVDVGQALSGRPPPPPPSGAADAVLLASAPAAAAAAPPGGEAVAALVRAASRYAVATRDLASLRGDVAAAAPPGDTTWAAAPPARGADAAAALRDVLNRGSVTGGVSSPPSGGPLTAGAPAVVAAATATPPDTPAAPRALALRAAAARTAERGAAASALASARDAARAAAPARHARHTRVALAGVAWGLAEPDGSPFLDVALGRTVVAAESNPDGSGASKLVLTSLSVRDPAARLGAAPGTDAGGVLVQWNPDASWEGDPAARVVAKLAPAAAGYSTIYEHAEATLHPLAVHVSDAVAAGLWDYFFPSVADGGGVADAKPSRRQEAFKRAVAAPASRLLRRGGGGGDLPPSASTAGLAGLTSPGVLSEEDETQRWRRRRQRGVRQWRSNRPAPAPPPRVAPRQTRRPPRPPRPTPRPV